MLSTTPGCPDGDCRSPHVPLAALFGYVAGSKHGRWITLQDPDCGPGPNIEADAHEALRRDLVRAVRKVCPRSLAEDAEDLVQESFIRLLRARKLDGASN